MPSYTGEPVQEEATVAGCSISSYLLAGFQIDHDVTPAMVMSCPSKLHWVFGRNENKWTHGQASSVKEQTQ
jgi:hypothetical protein